MRQSVIADVSVNGSLSEMEHSSTGSESANCLSAKYMIQLSLYGHCSVMFTQEARWYLGRTE